MSVKLCGYDLAYMGLCKEVAGEATGRCAQHSGIACSVCRGPASRECSHTGQFVCGAPLCDDCEGFVDTSQPSGTWGFMNHRHRRKDQIAEKD